MSDNIPFEIQLEIVKRLPLKSMIRFRLVSKPFNSFIGSSEFISTYNAHQPQPPPRLLVRYTNHVNTSDQTCLSILDDNTFTQQNFPVTFTKQLRDSQVIDCSHGLLCIKGYFYNSEILVLWNPLIGNSVGIELPFYRSFSTAIGFGVCPVTNDPTIVMIEHTNMSSDHFVPWVVKVFTLSSRTWKTLQSTNMPRKTINAQSSQAVIGKFIYWSACERIFVKVTDTEKLMVNMILSFDMTTHEFEVIEFPDTLSHSFYMNVLKLRDSLAILEYIPFSEFRVGALWMMENGITKSFKMLFTIHAPNAPFRTMLAFRESGEPIMETEDNKKDFATLEAYDPWLEQITDLGIIGETGSLFVRSYTETLLLLDQSDGHIFKN